MNGTALLWLPDVLSAAGLQIVTYDGWETRSRSSGGFVDGKPFAVFWHHTASDTSPENDASYCCYGSDSRPICNLMIDRDGKVWILAAGATNTNGKGKQLGFSRGQVPLDCANTSVLGMECCNSGVGEAWPVAQIDAMFKASNAVNAHLGNVARDAATHAHYAPDRKIDPATADAVQGAWHPSDINSSGTWENGDMLNECEARSGQMPPPKPPPVTAVFGPDVSKWQQGLIPPEPPGVAFMEARASKGFLQDAAASIAMDYCWPRGIPFAAYHFVYPTSGHSASGQANAFSESVGGNREIRCMLDWEEDSDDECHPPGLPQHPTWDDVLEVADAIENLGYRCTLLYTGKWYWDKTGKPDMSGAGFALINSNYGPKPKPEGDAASVYAATGGDNSPGWEPYGGLTPTFLQFSDQVDWGNKQLDMNAFKGDPSELAQWFTTWVSIPEPPEPEPEPEPTPPPEPEPTPPPEPGPPAPPLTEDDKSMVVALDGNGTAWIGDGMTKYRPTEDDFNVKVLLAKDDCFRFVNTKGERVDGWQNVHEVGDNVIAALGREA